MHKHGGKEILTQQVSGRCSFVLVSICSAVLSLLISYVTLSSLFLLDLSFSYLKRRDWTIWVGFHEILILPCQAVSGKRPCHMMDASEPSGSWCSLLRTSWENLLPAVFPDSFTFQMSPTPIPGSLTHIIKLFVR